MRHRLRFILLLFTSASPVTALADSLTVFNIQGTLQSGGSAMGTLSIYAPAGGPIEIQIDVNEGGTSYLFGGGPFGVGAFATTSTYRFINGPGGGVNFNYLYLSFPVSSLLGYAGGPLCSLSVPCANVGASSLELTDGLYPEDPKFHPTVDSFTTLTATVPSVPEPETVVLVGTGLVGLLSAIRRRRPL